MDFKDRLKAARLSRGLSQKELARSIYVSRSAVAKWENGLGLPCKDSYYALLRTFSLEEAEFPLYDEEEARSTASNRKRHLVRTAIFYAILLFIIAAPLVLLYATEHGFGFTPSMAAGTVWKGTNVLQSDGYTVFYDTVNGEVAVMDSFCVIKKVALGYQKIDIASSKRTVFDTSGNTHGDLYSFARNDGGYIHIFRTERYLVDSPAIVQFYLLKDLKANEKGISVLANAYFETDEAISEFEANGENFVLK